jgi:hypothetical protein
MKSPLPQTRLDPSITSSRCRAESWLGKSVKGVYTTASGPGWDSLAEAILGSGAWSGMLRDPAHIGWLNVVPVNQARRWGVPTRGPVAASALGPLEVVVPSLHRDLMGE